MPHARARARRVDDDRGSRTTSAVDDIGDRGKTNAEAGRCGPRRGRTTTYDEHDANRRRRDDGIFVIF
jgi:hypothetical protein